MHRILILGAGFGGLAAAHRLRQKLEPADEVIVVDQRPHFMMGFRKSWGLVGEAPLEAGQRPLNALEDFGIRHRPGTLTALDPAGRAAEVDGQRLEADALILALGAELAPGLIPGLPEHSFNVYDPSAIPATSRRSTRGG